MEVLHRIRDGGVIAVLRGIDEETLLPMAEALVDGGITALEVTADTKGAAGMVEELDASIDAPGTVIGAGTVLDGPTARRMIAAGAEFVLTPTLKPEVVETANRYGITVIPGVFTPSEAQRAYEVGADAIKLFPAKSGGPGHLSAIRGPLEQVEIIPTGGISLENGEAYLEAGAFALGVGSALLTDEILDNRDWTALEQRASEYTALVEAARE